ncbi:MAG: hypothetical protein H0X64_02495 [Gemmatimonadaceae bacterium]|nr:hypothetical protein [Gemmatimonadaceae bacterium]
MSDSARPEKAAFQELETLVRHLAAELASFRRRALTAEARVRELEGGPAHDGDPDSPGSDDLARRHAERDAQVAKARERAEQMLERVRFLRHQARSGGGA